VFSVKDILYAAHLSSPLILDTQPRELQSYTPSVDPLVCVFHNNSSPFSLQLTISPVVASSIALSTDGKLSIVTLPTDTNTCAPVTIARVMTLIQSNFDRVGEGHETHSISDIFSVTVVCSGEVKAVTD
jgi:hypothetical protein